MNKHTLSFVSAASSALACLWLMAAPAAAEQKLRVQVDQRGDFALIGNTLGWDCGAAGASLPAVGEVDVDMSVFGFFSCGLNGGDTSPDLFWRADEPTAGEALASPTYTSADARTTATLALPSSALVTHAFLYWGARRVGTAADTSVTIERPGSFSQPITAVSSYLHQVGGDAIYQSVADVTDLVRASGSGAYRVSGVDARSFIDANEDIVFAGWALVVLYQLDSDPLRNLAVFDGLDAVDQLGAVSTVSLSGFLVPNAGFDAKLGTLVYEGDNFFFGDSLRFGLAPLDASDNLSDAQNPADNFFNGTRSWLGQPVNVVGDLPQLAGTAATMAGMDLDVIDVTDRVAPGQNTVNLQALTTLDAYFMGAFVTSISTFRPDFVTSQKAAKDVNGGAALAGDEIEYTITATNSGNDVAIETVVTDPLPEGVTFVSGSLEIKTGFGAGALTDDSGDDQGRYDAATRSVVVNVGAGATATQGGSVTAGGSTSFVFRVTIDADTQGVISNQGSIEAAGERGAPRTKFLTDGNGAAPGNPATDTPTGECTSDMQCSAAQPICDVSTGVCVECTDDLQCAGATATCDPNTRTCVCNASSDTCMDSDGDGLTDPEEIAGGTDPADSDSDDDGVLDGSEPDWDKDSDGDGLINALDPDSDDDGLYDGTELGLGCDAAGTDKAQKHCRPDGDLGATKTDPLNPDTDGGGERDGSEDHNLDGVVDPGERNPTAGNGADDNTGSDQDGDGLSDETEDFIGTDPADADSDDDGLLDGDERNPADDTDGDGLINALDPDSDDDALPDGLEAGKDCGNAATAAGKCTPDADMGATTTSPVNPDTDGGGASDGSEDANRNGQLDSGERDPTAGHPEDDHDGADADSDGLSDELEDGLGSDKNDADSDDDGLLDGEENNPAHDTDGDGLINILDPDSDGDGLPDGLENGKGCSDPATDVSKGACLADADLGATTTSAVKADTDNGGVSDGEEDSNKNGVVDSGERDPNRSCDDPGLTACDAVPPPMPPTSNLRSLAGGGCSVLAAGGAGVAGWLLPLVAAWLLVVRRKRRKA